MGRVGGEDGSSGWGRWVEWVVESARLSVASEKVGKMVSLQSAAETRTCGSSGESIGLAPALSSLEKNWLNVLYVEWNGSLWARRTRRMGKARKA